jgi:hypothetical protein
MAEVIDCPHLCEQNFGISDKELCVSCSEMKKYVQELSAELKSAQLIIKLLREELRSNMHETSTTNNSTENSLEWKIVSANKGKDRNRSVIITPLQIPKSIPTIINRYILLDNLNCYPQIDQQREHANTLFSSLKNGDKITESENKTQEIKRRDKKTTSDKKGNKDYNYRRQPC